MWAAKSIKAQKQIEFGEGIEDGPLDYSVGYLVYYYNIFQFRAKNLSKLRLWSIFVSKF